MCPFGYFGQLCATKCNCPHHFECHNVCGCVNSSFINETTAETCDKMTDSTASMPVYTQLIQLHVPVIVLSKRSWQK